jgi:hypothetical protein
MEGFKTNPKMAKNLPCYKKGGAVYKSRHSEKAEMSEDVAQDKKIVKKAFAMHDKQEHPGEKTDLSKLRKGGRAKKDCGTVRKYSTGGGVYGAKKTDADIKSIDKAKKFKPAMLCGGKSVKKYSGEDGSYVESERPGMGARIGKGVQDFAKSIKENIIGTPEQNRIGQETLDKQATEGSTTARLLGGRMTKDMENKAAAAKSAAAKKRGGKVKAMNEGGSSGLKNVDAEENPGLAKLPTNVRNKMGYMQKGGKAKKMMTGGTCS